jgi:hypothetical protein
MCNSSKHVRRRRSTRPLRMGAPADTASRSGTRAVHPRSTRSCTPSRDTSADRRRRPSACQVSAALSQRARAARWRPRRARSNSRPDERSDRRRERHHRGSPGDSAKNRSPPGCSAKAGARVSQQQERQDRHQHARQDSRSGGRHGNRDQRQARTGREGERGRPRGLQRRASLCSANPSSSRANERRARRVQTARWRPRARDVWVRRVVRR